MVRLGSQHPAVVVKLTGWCWQDMPDPALVAAVSGRVQRWQSWPALLGLALQVRMGKLK